MTYSLGDLDPDTAEEIELEIAALRGQRIAIADGFGFGGRKTLARIDAALEVLKGETSVDDVESVVLALISDEALKIIRARKPPL